MSVAIKEVEVEHELRSKVQALIPDLTGMEKAVAELRFCVPAYTLAEVGKRLGISRYSVRIIETQLIRRVRES